MQKYIEVTGKTEEEALNKGLRQLGLDRDDVSVEILDRGKTGFLGIGSVPAKVKLTYEVPDEPEVRPEPAPAPAAEEKAPAPAPRQQPRRDKQAPAPVQKEVRKPAAPAAAPAAKKADDDVVEAICRFQTGLFAHMGVEATPVVTKEGDAYQVVLEGEDLGALIGRRGETLDAIQQLTSYAVNRTGGRVRVQLDAEGYREKREQSLRHLAQKVAGKVVRYRRSVTLEPMNAYERHVIHTALQDVPGVTTYSTGVDPNRRVIVAYDREKR